MIPSPPEGREGESPPGQGVIPPKRNEGFPPPSALGAKGGCSSMVELSLWVGRVIGSNPIILLKEGADSLRNLPSPSE